MGLVVIAQAALTDHEIWRQVGIVVITICAILACYLWLTSK